MSFLRFNVCMLATGCPATPSSGKMKVGREQGACFEPVQQTGALSFLPRIWLISPGVSAILDVATFGGT